MKKMFLLLIAVGLMSFTFSDTSCTVTTDCGSFTFNENVSVSVNQTNGQSSIIVISNSSTGVVLKQISCNKGSSISTRCSSDNNGGSDEDLCSSLPSFLKPFFGCNK